MSSKVNQALFDLISSLSKSEKRYFKLISSRHKIGEENNYVRLFDFIDKQEVYDEDKLFNHFEGEAFLNRFSITKKRLYDHILTALDSFHSSSSIDAQLYKMLHAFDILFEKSLYEQSRRILRSAEKLAVKHEKHEVLLLVYKKNRKLLETGGGASLLQDQVFDVSEKTNESIDSIKGKSDLWKVKSKLFMHLAQKGVARSKQDAELYKEICAPLLSDCKVDLYGTVESKYLYFHILSAYYYAIGDMNMSLDNLKNNLNLFNEKGNSNFIEINKQVSVYTNAIYVSDRLGHYKDATIYLSQLKKMASQVQTNEDIHIKLFSSISSIEFSLCIRKGDFSTAQSIALDVENRLEMYASKITPSRRAFLEFKLAVVAMGTKDYASALKWVNSILNNSKLDKNEDIIGFTQLLDLLIHIELNHEKLLPYSLKSTQRFFKTRNRLYTFEKVFLQFISRLIKSKDQFEAATLWEELYNELGEIKDDTFESIAFEYFDFKSWAESKLKRKSFDSVVKEKYNENIRKAS